MSEELIVVDIGTQIAISCLSAGFLNIWFFKKSLKFRFGLKKVTNLVYLTEVLQISERRKSRRLRANAT